MPRPKVPFKDNPKPPSSETLPLKKPDWFRIRLQEGERFQTISSLVKENRLATVCEEARCPNIYECWNSGTATFMLMGDTCTRACKFCHVNTGKPRALDPLEPLKVAGSVQKLDLSYVVLTSVNRDELADEGSRHFSDTVKAIKALQKPIRVEALTPDFRLTQETSIQTMLESKVDVLAHNIETVRRLVPHVRDRRCDHDQSLRFHQISKRLNPKIVSKSSIMLGLGETQEEVLEAMRELRSVDVDILTLGQYLQPTKNHLPIHRYWHPEEFLSLEQKGLEMGFKFVAAGPLVRSSYRAAEFFVEKMLKTSNAPQNEESLNAH